MLVLKKCVESKEIGIIYVKTEYRISDMFTKG